MAITMSEESLEATLAEGLEHDTDYFCRQSDPVVARGHAILP